MDYIGLRIRGDFVECGCGHVMPTKVYVDCDECGAKYMVSRFTGELIRLDKVSKRAFPSAHEECNDSNENKKRCSSTDKNVNP